MSDTNPSARPRQLTMAGWFVVGGSLLLLLSIFDTVTNLNSVDTREEVTKVLTSPSGVGFDLSVGQAISVMRAGLTVAAVCAAAAAVLGFFVLQRNRGARIALSIVAVPILLTAPLTGGLVGALVAAATALLWSGPARDWFAGRPVRQPAEPRQSPPASTPPASTPPPSDGPPDPPAPVTPTIPTSAYPSPTQPPATRGFGDHPVDPRSGPAASVWAAPVAQSSAPTSRVSAGPVPVPTKIACLLTWVFSGAVAVMYSALVVVLIVARSEIVDLVVKSPAWEQANLRQDMLVPVLWVGCLMFLGWAVGACVLAVFTWRRHNWARYLLVASAAAALVAATFAFPVGIPHQIAAGVTIGTLLSRSSRAWFAAPAYAPAPGPRDDGPAGPRVW